MVLPNTGSITANQIENEFPDACIDGGPPTRLSEYRGAQVVKNGVNTQLPSGEIKYSDFRGVSYGYYIDLMLIGGGGGGGAGDYPIDISLDGSGSRTGGGGGAGEYKLIENIFVVPGQTHTIVIGRGGGGKSRGDASQRGGSGGDTICIISTQQGTLTYQSFGGGGGGGATRDRNGGDGASGGGGGCDTSTTIGSGGSGTGSRGNRGGNSSGQSESAEGGGGGGYIGQGADGVITEAESGRGGTGRGVVNFFGTARFKYREVGVCGGGGGGRSTGIDDPNTSADDPPGTKGGGGASHGGGKGSMASLNLLNGTFRISRFQYNHNTGVATITLHPPQQPLDNYRYNQLIRVRDLDGFFNEDVICEWIGTRRLTANFGLHPTAENVDLTFNNNNQAPTITIPVGQGAKGSNLTGGGGGGGCGANPGSDGGSGSVIIRYPKCQSINVSINDGNAKIYSNDNNNFLVIGHHNENSRNEIVGSFTT